MLTPAIARVVVKAGIPFGFVTITVIFSVLLVMPSSANACINIVLLPTVTFLPSFGTFIY